MELVLLFAKFESFFLSPVCFFFIEFIIFFFIFLLVQYFAGPKFWQLLKARYCKSGPLASGPGPTLTCNQGRVEPFMGISSPVQTEAFLVSILCSFRQVTLFHPAPRMVRLTEDMIVARWVLGHIMIYSLISYEQYNF